ncbi:pyridoxal-phosphate-dependent aminotransferase family protein [Haloparvum sp. PAK95]|uniref:pyridoxal-phosphate-dependent aminotransferase family protein n=1 Tax=Haloparvum sp. PAK95 TaxID=3418962 RepID=UPI003D2F1849
MPEDFLLLDPGLAPLTDEVRAAMDEQLVPYRSPDFESVYERAQDGLEYVFTASTLDDTVTSEGGTPLILDGTATMAMEAAVANVVSEGDEVVALVNGKYGRRFARIADRYTDDVIRVEASWGESIPVGKVADAVSPDTDLVTMVHNETSTGLLNPVEPVGELANEADATFVVDGSTSIGGDEFRIDDWGVDLAITDAHEALAAPPGLSAVYVTDRARGAIDGDGAPFYEDLDAHLRAAERHQTPFAAAEPLFHALAVAVEAIEAEGMVDRIARHRTQAAAVREGFEAMGLELFGNPTGPTDYSNTTTTVALPDSVRGDGADEFEAELRNRNVAIGGGQGHLDGEVFRVSNLGHFKADEVVRGIETVGEALEAVGADVDPEAGMLAAKERLDQG